MSPRRRQTYRSLLWELVVVAIAIGLAWLWTVNGGPMAFGRWFADWMQPR